MTNNSHLDIADPKIFQLIEYGNQINKTLVELLRTLSSFVLGLILLMALTPISLVLIIITTIISRLALEYLSFNLKRAESIIPNAEERNLMEALINIDDSIESLRNAQDSLKSNSLKKIYYKLFFGSSLKKTLTLQIKVKSAIERKVYPDLHKGPNKEQIKRLLRAYEGVELIND